RPAGRRPGKEPARRPLRLQGTCGAERRAGCLAIIYVSSYIGIYSHFAGDTDDPRTFRPCLCRLHGARFHGADRMGVAVFRLADRVRRLQHVPVGLHRLLPGGGRVEAPRLQARLLRLTRKKAAMRIAVLAAALAAAAPAPAAETLVLAPGTVPEWKAVYGRVEARDLVPARARIGGTVVELLVSEGDTVEAGQRIAVVRDDKIAFQIAAF